MSLRTLLTQTIIVIPMSGAPVEDAYGNPIDQPSSPREYKGRLEQTEATEVTQGRDTLISEWRLILPPEALIGGRDRVQAAGLTFEVVGEPARPSARANTHHLEARLRLIDG